MVDLPLPETWEKIYIIIEINIRKMPIGINTGTILTKIIPVINKTKPAGAVI